MRPESDWSGILWLACGVLAVALVVLAAIS